MEWQILLFFFGLVGKKIRFIDFNDAIGVNMNNEVSICRFGFCLLEFKFSEMLLVTNQQDLKCEK